MTLDQPFPLKVLFRRRFIPALVGFIGVFLVLIGVTASHVVEQIYLELAQRRAQTIARAVKEHAPAPWHALMSGQGDERTMLAVHSEILSKAFGDEVRELNLLELKVYDLNRKVLFATHKNEIGSTENGVALRNVIKKSTSEIVTKVLADGTKQYELYVPVFDDTGSLRSVFELYEPVGYLNTILIRAAAPIIIIPGVLLLLLTLALDKIVGRAQADIDARTQAINELRKRIESFVSLTAVDAALNANAIGQIASESVITTLLFSDIRDFTGFSEDNSPEDVVAFLNELMTLQVEIIQRHGGDVDKMIGDAILARFDGDQGRRSALQAAREIQIAVIGGNFPRPLGIGVYQGEVISGAIGPENRRDFTVIGDSVNISARLCSAAKGNEIVIDAKLADDTFGPLETIQVKGRQHTLAIRRWKGA